MPDRDKESGAALLAGFLLYGLFYGKNNQSD
jgi:hypothetical protein